RERVREREARPRPGSGTRSRQRGQPPQPERLIRGLSGPDPGTGSCRANAEVVATEGLAQACDLNWAFEPSEAPVQKPWVVNLAQEIVNAAAGAAIGENAPVQTKEGRLRMAVGMLIAGPGVT